MVSTSPVWQGITNHWRYHRLVHHVRVFPSQFTSLAFGLPNITLANLIGEPPEINDPILGDLCLPNHSHGPGHNDFLPLLSIVKKKQPNMVVELGTAHGNTTANVCAQCSTSRVITVNALPEQISGALTTFALTKDEIGRQYRLNGFDMRVTQVYSNTMTLDLAPYVEQQSVDLAIIDACHDTNFVVHDFNTVRPFIKPGGLVLLHDTHPSMEDHLVGSYRACMRLRRKGFDIRHLTGTWWGVWRKPAEELHTGDRSC